MTPNPHRRVRQRGQAMVVLVFAMIAAIAMVGLIVDGGNAWAHQRQTQNGADSASEAGAVVLGKRFVSTDAALVANLAYWDGQVAAAVHQSATENGITVPFAYYTDICGRLLTPNGGAATGTGDAALVGGGSLPLETGTTSPDCSTPPVGRVAGVFSIGQQDFVTFFSRVVGRASFRANTEATAVMGYLKQSCAGNASGNCILLPLAFFYNLVYCDGSGNAQNTGTFWEDYKNVPIVLPICKSSSGNIGWLDWSTGNGGVGGPDGLRDCVQRAASSDPCVPSILQPQWFPIAQSGGTNSAPLENDINAYHGEVVQLAIWNLMCHSDPDQSLATGPAPYGCPANDACTLPGQGFGGDNDTGCHPNWYHLQPFAPFRLDQAFTSGNNTPACNPPWSNPDPAHKTSNCLIGTFIDYSIPGEVGSTPNGSGAIGIQLIK